MHLYNTNKLYIYVCTYFGDFSTVRNWLNSTTSVCTSAIVLGNVLSDSSTVVFCIHDNKFVTKVS